MEQLRIVRENLRRHVQPLRPIDMANQAQSPETAPLIHRARIRQLTAPRQLIPRQAGLPAGPTRRRVACAGNLLR